MPLEDQHRTQADSPLARAADIDPHTFGLLEELVTARGVKGNERPHPFTTEVHDLLRILGLQALEAREEIIADPGGIVDQVEPLDFLNDGPEEDRTGGIAHPGVELAERPVRSELQVAEVVACCLGLFGERYHVGRAWEVPMLMCPELAGGADAGLDFVDDEEDVMFLGQFAEAAEEGRGRMMVAAFGLDGLDYHCTRGEVVRCELALNIVKSLLLYLLVILDVFFERIFQQGKGGLWPIEGWDIKLVDRF